MHANAHTSKKVYSYVLKKNQNLHQQIIKLIKMVLIKHLIQFCFTVRLVLHQHLNSRVSFEFFGKMAAG